MLRLAYLLFFACFTGCTCGADPNTLYDYDLNPLRGSWAGTVSEYDATSGEIIRKSPVRLIVRSGDERGGFELRFNESDATGVERPTEVRLIYSELDGSVKFGLETFRVFEKSADANHLDLTMEGQSDHNGRRIREVIRCANDKLTLTRNASASEPGQFMRLREYSLSR